MKLKSYHAPTLTAALAQVKQDLGNDAVILHTRNYRRGGLFGIGARTMVEVTASNDVNVAPPRLRKREAADRPRPGRALQQAYNIPPKQPAGAAKPQSQPQPQVLTVSPAAIDSQLAAELKELRQLVHRVARSTDQADRKQQMPEELFELYLSLLNHEVTDELADEIVAKVRKEAGEDLDAAKLRWLATQAIAKMVPVGSQTAKIKPRESGQPYKLALIGPTGVGKTTTLAKLAATYKLREKLSVAMITIDTYRIAAVEQLRTYAEIIGVPLHVANSPMEMKQVVERCRGYDVVLIDTAGRSQRDNAKLDQLKAFISAAEPDEVHLVLASNARHDVMIEAAERFAQVRTDRIIFTKLDEAVSFGVLLDVARTVNKQLSFVTTGQEVPRDIEHGCGQRLAKLIMGEPLS